MSGPVVADAVKRNGQPRHLLHVFSTFAMGGPQVRFATLANHFGDKYRHSIVALDGNFACQSRLGPNANAELLLDDSKKIGTLASLLLAHRVLRKARPDLLLTYNWGAVEWAMANRIFHIARHVHLEDGFRPDEATGQLRRRILIRRFALARTAMVVVPSRNLERIALAVWRLPRRQVRYIPNGIDVGKFGGAADPKLVPGLHKEPGQLVVGTVATLRAEKNLGRLISAFAEIAGRFDVRLVIAGDGPERAALEARAAALGLSDKIFFPGHVGQPERLLGLFDLFALSSDTEQMPISVLEAMAASLPVVSVDVGDVKSMLPTESSSCVVPKGEDAAFVDQIAALLASPRRRYDLGRFNRARVEQEFSEDAMVAAYDQVFSL